MDGVTLLYSLSLCCLFPPPATRILILFSSHRILTLLSHVHHSTQTYTLASQYLPGKHNNERRRVNSVIIITMVAFLCVVSSQSDKRYTKKKHTYTHILRCTGKRNPTSSITHTRTRRHGQEMGSGSEVVVATHRITVMPAESNDPIVMEVTRPGVRYRREEQAGRHTLKWMDDDVDDDREI
jgi:hypothetical protein